MGLIDWFARYEREAEPLDVPPGFSLWFDERLGFFYYKADGNTFIIDHLCTRNGMKDLHGIIRGMAKESGCRRLMTQTFKRPAAYARLLHASLDIRLSGYRANGRFYWVFVEELR